MDEGVKGTITFKLLDSGAVETEVDGDIATMKSRYFRRSARRVIQEQRAALRKATRAKIKAATITEEASEPAAPIEEIEAIEPVVETVDLLSESEYTL